MVICFSGPPVFGLVHTDSELTGAQNARNGLYTCFEKDYEWWVELAAATTKGILAGRIADDYHPPFRYIQDPAYPVLKDAGEIRKKAPPPPVSSLSPSASPALPPVEKKETPLHSAPSLENKEYDGSGEDARGNGVKLNRIIIVNDNMRKIIQPEKKEAAIEVYPAKEKPDEERMPGFDRKRGETDVKEALESWVNIQKDIRRMIAKHSASEKRKIRGESSRTTILKTEHESAFPGTPVSQGGTENPDNPDASSENISLNWYTGPTNYIYTGDPSFFEETVASGIEQAATFSSKIILKFFLLLKWIKEGGWLIFLISSLLLFPVIVMIKR